MENSTLRILLVRHGNICRSAMARIMHHMVDVRGLDPRFIVDSAATTSDVQT